jgi:hypothetical protein
MFYSFIVVCVLGGHCPMRIDDLRGPYDTLEECFVRNTVIIKDVAEKFPVLRIEGLCSKISPEKFFKDKDKDKEGGNDSKETGTGKFI